MTQDFSLSQNSRTYRVIALCFENACYHFSSPLYQSWDIETVNINQFLKLIVMIPQSIHTEWPWSPVLAVIAPESI